MITLVSYLILAMSAAMGMELLMGNFGMIIPFTAIMLFYFSITCGWYAGNVTAAVFGFTLDILYGREYFITPFLLMLIVAVAHIWISHKESKSMMMHGVAGIITAGIYTLPLPFACFMNAEFNISLMAHNVSATIFAMMFSAFLMPSMIIIMDLFSENFGLPLYRHIKNNIDRKKINP